MINKITSQYCRCKFIIVSEKKTQNSTTLQFFSIAEMCTTVSDPIGPPISLIGAAEIIPEDPGCGLTNDSCQNMLCCATFFCNTGK